MSHRTSTTVDHWFDLTEAEQYDHHSSYRSKPVRITSAWVSVRDGSVSSIRFYGYPVLKSGALGQVRTELWMGKKEAHVAEILRAHGIEVPA